MVSTTYMGLHEYGKRTRNPNRQIITRKVPPSYREDWRKAQQTLKSNFLFGKRNARRQYLLRGLVKCGLCQLTYVGVAAPPERQSRVLLSLQREVWLRGIYGANGAALPLEGRQWRLSGTTDLGGGGGVSAQPRSRIEHLQATTGLRAERRQAHREHLVRLEDTLAGKAASGTRCWDCSARAHQRGGPRPAVG